MTFREKLADWISGGLLSGARSRAEYLSDTNEYLRERVNYLEDVLIAIDSQRTERANATVQRMAKIARDAISI